MIVILTASVACYSFAVLDSSDWSNDAAHSRLGFSIQHMGITDVNGEFKKFDVKINAPGGDFSLATIEMTAESSSIYTGIEMRDNHLKTADFFDVEKYPKLSFTSTKVSKVKKDVYQVSGNLTMHGVTKPVILTANHNGTVKSEAGKNVAGFKLSGVVKRSDFSVGQPSSGLSDEVKLLCDLEVAEN